jgi:hypothetical protein
MPNFWNWQRRTPNQSGGSAALAIEEELHPIQFYTAAGMVTANIVPNGQRMLDILNGQQALRVRDVEHIPFNSNALAIRLGDWTSVDVDSVLLATPPPHISPRQLRIQRRQRRVALDLGPFTVIGNAHMAPGFKLNDFLLRQHERFIPITSAVLRHADDPTFDRSVPVVLVSVGQVRAIRDLLS